MLKSAFKPDSALKIEIFYFKIAAHETLLIEIQNWFEINYSNAPNANFLKPGIFQSQEDH